LTPLSQGDSPILFENIVVDEMAFTLLVENRGVSSAQDFDKGFAANNKGDYATALRESRPLAE